MREEGGQALVVVVLAMTVIICFLGLAIDVGHLRYERHRLQSATDAAALAAGLELRICGSVPNCPAMQAAATSAMTENGYTGSTLITNCSSTAGTALTLMVNSPSCALGAKDPNTGSNRYVEVVASETARTYFGQFVGFDYVKLSARAEATRNPGPNCIYALDPSGAQAIAVLVGIAVTSNCGIVDESSSSLAMTCIVGAFISAPKISVTGGTGNLLCGLSTKATKGVPVPTPADPLAYLPAPANANGACGTSTGSPYRGSSTAVNLLLAGTYVFNPGVYCGGISITAGVLMNVTFNPGVYILKQGPGLLGVTQGGLTITLSLLSNITGTGVTFYNTGPFGGYSITAPAAVGLSNVNLSAPTSGTYGGMLFMQDKGNTSSGTFVANLLQGSKLEGAFYLPNASVAYGVGAISSNYNILVAKDIAFNVAVASTFGNNYAALGIGSPLNGDAAVLVE
ncbi:pilus assembly protein TadG-related protein [Granulicella pectinivorans]|uniref:pilus assembly protein TadG-related protein n=1 Tax=Granulicella pectinivorans TaxID=474950 RepID=UPI001FE5C5F4|nr:pilus assembly protein TadG-related protein [Granulicella pectinivorans]